MVRATSHAERVRRELVLAGATQYGISKSEARALPAYIFSDETIEGVVYGQIEGSSAMMVATDRRLIYLDVHALNSEVDEVSYDLFGDISVNDGILYSTVEIRTRPREYRFSMVNRRCARQFLNAIEDNAIDTTKRLDIKTEKPNDQVPLRPKPEEIEFLARHNEATLSSRGDDGYPHGVTVFYVYSAVEPNTIYTLTRSSTQTVANIQRRPKVAYTITDKDHLATMQVYGIAHVEKDAKKVDSLLRMLKKNAPLLTAHKKLPVTRIRTGSYVALRTDIQRVSLKRYSDSEPAHESL